MFLWSAERGARFTRAAFSAGPIPMAIPEMVLMKAWVAGAAAKVWAALAATGFVFRNPVTRLSTGVPMLSSTLSCTCHTSYMQRMRDPPP